MNALVRLLDVRGDEKRPVVATFGSLLLIVFAHTVLETVRDALFLANLGSGALGYVYIAAAALTLVVGGLSSKLSARVSARRALVVSQLVSAAGTALFFVLPPTRPVLMSLYAFSAVTGALLVPQFWATAAAVFHAAQSRRLFGTIAMAGILGAVLGSVSATVLLLALRVECLLVLSALAFAASAALIGVAPRVRALRPAGALRGSGTWLTAFREEPILRQIAVVVALGSITTMLIDYVFKSVVAATIPAAELGFFFARVAGVMNVLAFVVQLLLARRALAKAGVIGSAGITPSLMLMGSVLTFLSGGALLVVLGTKLVDAALRHSIHRTGVELVYLAVPAPARNRAKPFIDGAVARASQAAAASLVLLVNAMAWGSIRHLALLATLSAAAWGAATYALRRPYLEIFRRTLLGRAIAGDHFHDELDHASADLLVEALSSPRPREVLAAINALARRKRSGAIPALVLLVDDEEVIERALEIFGSSPRRDWLRFAERLGTDRRERVRRAALRALARAKAPLGEVSALAAPAADERPWIVGYLAATAFTLEPEGSKEPVLRLLTRDARGRDALLGVLTALGDTASAPALEDLLLAVVEQTDAWHDADTLDLTARAAASLGAARLVPWLIARLEHREGRSAIRQALASIGTPAFDALAAALLERETPRRLRIHLPRTLELFANQSAAELLLQLISSDPDGLVRYKSLRALGRVVVDGRVAVPLLSLRRLARRDLGEHFRVLGLRVRLPAEPLVSSSERGGVARATHRLMVRLLDEKAKQSLERVFRLIKLCFPEEDIHRVHAAAVDGDASARANAAEFLDTLLAPRRRGPDDGLRGLLRLVTEDLPGHDRVARAAALTGTQPPADASAALAALMEDPDRTLASLAGALAITTGDPQLDELAGPASVRRPSVAAAAVRLIGEASLLEEAHG